MKLNIKYVTSLDYLCKNITLLTINNKVTKQMFSMFYSVGFR